MVYEKDTFSIDLLTAYSQAHELYVRKLLDLISEYSKLRETERNKLPYNLNVIEELHINENAHSRILHKLLLYKNTNGDYPILQSLISRLGKECSSFNNIEIKCPVITQEKKRIDLWIRDKDYTIIFENKVYNANDQEAQLERYIEKSISSTTFPHILEDIYVVYMPQRPGQPEDQSWGKYLNDPDLVDRYVSFSFLTGVLPWLKEEILSLPQISYDTKDQIFHTAIIQYVDYLDGLFGLRKEQELMNTKLKNLIAEKLNLNECIDDYSRYEKIAEQYEECINLSNKLWEMRQEAIKTYWRDLLKEKYPNINCNTNSSYIGVLLHSIEGNIYVHIDEDNKAVYCQVEFEDRKSINGTIIQKIKEDGILSELNNNCAWTYFQKNPDREVFRCFEQVIEWINSHSH